MILIVFIGFCKSIPRNIVMFALVTSAVLMGCKKATSSIDTRHTIRLRSYDKWFPSLATNLSLWANGRNTFQLTTLPPFDWLQADQYRQTVLSLSSFYVVSNLPFASNGSIATLASLDDEMEALHGLSKKSYSLPDVG